MTGKKGTFNIMENRITVYYEELPKRNTITNLHETTDNSPSCWGYSVLWGPSSHCEAQQKFGVREKQHIFLCRR